MTPSEAEDAAKLFVYQVCDHFAVPTPRVDIHWDIDDISLLGLATGNFLIRFNPDWLEAIDDVFMQTVRHEAAHIATVQRSLARHANQLADWSPHGREWRRAMMLLDADVVPRASQAELDAFAASQR